MSRDDDYFARIEEELSGAYEGPGPLPVPYCQWLADFDQSDEEGRERQLYACAGQALHRAEQFASAIETLWQLHRQLRTASELRDVELTLDGKTGKKMLGDLLEEFKKGRHIGGEEYKLVDEETLLSWDEARQMRNDLCHGFFTKREIDLRTQKGMRRTCEDLLRMAIFLERATISVQVFGGAMAHFLSVAREETQ